MENVEPGEDAGDDRHARTEPAGGGDVALDPVRETARGSPRRLGEGGGGLGHHRRRAAVGRPSGDGNVAGCAGSR